MQQLLGDELDKVFLIDQQKYQALVQAWEAESGRPRAPKALILIASGVNGGVIFQPWRMIAKHERSDIDWAMVADETIAEDSDETYKIYQEVDSVFKKHGQVSCKTANGSSFCIPYLESNALADDIALNRDESDVILYFFPSVPPEVNAHNRSYILSAFHRLYINNPQEWQKRTDALINKWREVFWLKNKYFHWGERLLKSVRSNALVYEAAEASRSAMQEPFRKLLYSTKY
jgi:hypothetical protein